MVTEVTFLFFWGVVVVSFGCGLVAGLLVYHMNKESSDTEG